MKFLQISLVMFILLFSSCTNEKKEVKSTELEVAHNNTTEEGLILMKQNCYACHSVTSKSHDEIIAPPMAAVKRRYLMTYSAKPEFVEAFTNWVLNPTHENALMRGAVTSFKVMPQMNFKKDDVIEIAEYIFDNEIEKPVWFQSQFNSMHQNGGFGNGNGNGKGKGRGRNLNF
ncbi:hypothetical protein [Lutibacter sp.]|uniref:c-type cytochrome n=1 Tax=Lutibacter sp. TaxID=1925666 RepID=UPI003567D4EE